MCGVVGFVSYIKKAELIDEFVKKVEHRGPDSLKSRIIEVNNKFIHLGSSRLAIRGGESENMPMTSESNSFITYNGEIFDINYLKTMSRSDFTYKSDTRLILDLLDENVDNVSKFNGMFALAYLNTYEKKLYLCRDKLGIKPLFYVKKNNELYFSSEIKSLIEVSKIDVGVNQNSLSKLFLFNGLNSNEDLGEIKSLKPGELLEINLLNDNDMSSKIYKIEKKHNGGDFKNLFKSVISDHLDADTPVDLFLSGGIDSSLLALTVKNELSKKVRHFSLSFEDNSYDESNLINKISNDLNLDSVIFSFDNKNINSYVNEAVHNMNSLVLDYSFVPTFILSKLTSDYSKAVLSGDGADELFGGYEWYRAIKYYNFLPLSIKKLLFNLIDEITLNGKQGGYLTNFDKLKLFFKYISADPYVQMLIWQSPYNNFQKKDLDYLKKELKSYIESKNSINENLREIDLNNYLYTNILPKVDVASMANSLEVRPPFLDERIIQFALSNKNTNKVGVLNTKLYLRNYASKTILSYLNNHRKHGFGFPIVDWFKNSGLEEIKQMYYENNLVYLERDENHINFLISNKNLNFNDYRELWSYYVVSKWFNKNNVKLI